MSSYIKKSFFIVYYIQRNKAISYFVLIGIIILICGFSIINFELYWAFIILLALAVLGITFINLNFAIFAYLIAYPIISSLKGEYIFKASPGAIYPQRLFVLFILFAFLLRLLLRKKKLEQTPINKYLNIFLGTYVLAVLFSYDFKISLFRLVTFFGEFYIFYFVLVNFFNKKEKYIKFIKIALTIAFMISIYVIVEEAIQRNPFSELTMISYYESITMAPLRGGFHRAQGTFSNPNGMGHYMAVYSILALAVFSIAKKKSEKIYFIVIFFFLLSANFFSLTRGAWLEFLFSFAIFVLLKKENWKFAFLFIPLVLIWPLYGHFFSDIVQWMHSNIFFWRNPAITFSGRTRLLHYGVKYVLERPILGYGPGVPYYYAIRFHSPSFLKYGPLYGIENGYLHMLLKIGIVGIGTFFLLLYKIFENLRKTYNNSEDKELSVLAHAVISIIIGYLVVSISMGPMLGFLITPILPLIAGLMRVGNNKGK